jgi:hypothetical protein
MKVLVTMKDIMKKATKKNTNSMKLQNTKKTKMTRR